MRIPAWKTAGLLAATVLGVAIVAGHSAGAEQKHGKPPAKRVIQRPRFAPRMPALARRPVPQRPASLGRATGPAGADRRLTALPGAQTRPAQFLANRNAFGYRGRFGYGNGFGYRNGFGNRNAFGNRNGFGNRNRFVGSLANRGRGGNGAPPGMRLIDMRVMPLPPGSGLPPIGETRFRSRQIVLQFGEGNTPEQITAVARRFGLTVVAQQTIGVLRRTVYTFRIDNGQPVAGLISQIDGAGLNVVAQPNYTYTLTADRGGADVGDPAQYVVQMLQLTAVHRISEGNDVVVALIDSRVDPNQPDLAGRIVDSYDAGCGADAPADAHGTGMAGAIASHVGLLGVAPDAKIMAICAFGGAGTPEATSANIIRGVDYAIEHGAKIINMSFAGPQDPALAQELQIAREKGILVVAAAGNAGPTSPPLYPGADPNVMAVTATDQQDRLFSGANQGSYVSVAAPGVNVLVPAPNGGVQLTTGTSVASANVSGVAALLIAQDPARKPEDIRAILVATAKHLGAAGTNPQFGAGLVDPLAALHSAPAIVGEQSAHAAPAAALQPQ